jgi:hypothetical protein
MTQRLHVFEGVVQPSSGGNRQDVDETTVYLTCDIQSNIQPRLQEMRQLLENVTSYDDYVFHFYNRIQLALKLSVNICFNLLGTNYSHVNTFFTTDPST